VRSTGTQYPGDREHTRRALRSHATTPRRNSGAIADRPTAGLWVWWYT